MTDERAHQTYQYQISLPNDIETIPQLNEFIEQMAGELELDTSLTMNLNLAVEEAVVNVMQYAYPPNKTGQVDIRISADSQALTVVVSDTGTPFDPTKQAEADTSLSAEKRPIGGLGIHLVRQIMDTVSYQYADGHNVLTLTKRY